MKTGRLIPAVRPSPMPPEPDFDHALGLFNRASFFDAHEALEDLWRELPPTNPSKHHLQGLVQVAVALHHEWRGNLRGARSVLDRAHRNLAGAELSFPSLDIESLRGQIEDWQKYLAGHNLRPALPKILRSTRKK